MEDKITTIIEEGRNNGLASHIVAEQIYSLSYCHSIRFKGVDNRSDIEKENERIKDKLKKIEDYILTIINHRAITDETEHQLIEIYRRFFKTPEQKQATDIIENANEELLKELKKQLSA